MVFSANDRILIKLLRQKKKYSAKILSQNFPDRKPWTLSGLNKLLQKINADVHFAF